MLARCSRRMLLWTHGARSRTRRIPAPDRTTPTSPCACAGSFGRSATGCWRSGYAAAGPPLGIAEFGAAEARESTGLFPSLARGNAPEFCVRDFLAQRSALHLAARVFPSLCGGVMRLGLTGAVLYNSPPSDRGKPPVP